MDNFFEQIERDVLAFVEKPGRYIGNEINIIKKDWHSARVRIALAFPDVYELGMSYLGFSILYHILNREPDLLAERVYAPWPDLQEKLRANGYPLFTLESYQPLARFDIIGFTFQYELHFSNILTMLDLGGIPLRASQRSRPFPLIVGGGPVAFNPEPMTAFFDAFVIGDGEEAFIELARKVAQAKVQDWTRTELLTALVQIPGVYVPEFYSESYDTSGAFTGLKSRNQAPARIRARIVPGLHSDYYPDRPLVPVIETTHDRVSVELARGCSRGCRFCNAGFIYRPVRERSIDDVVAQARQNIEATGYDEISLVSLSTCDYHQLEALLGQLHQAFENDMVNILFPSLRPEKFTPEIAAYASVVRRSGLTLAPEAGTEGLRQVINKNNTSADLIRAAELAYSKGWNLIKLYFMIGLPTETDADLDGIVDLIQAILALGRKFGGHKKLNVSISPFVPKPQTPFQWEQQVDVEEMQRKIGYIRSHLRSKSLKISMHSAHETKLEAALSRGDRKLADVIEAAWRGGAKFDAWSEHFDFSIWEQAFASHGLSLAQYDRALSPESCLPWDHIDKGITKKFLLDERQRALGREVRPDCRDGQCNRCGLMGQQVCQQIIQGEITGSQPVDAANPVVPANLAPVGGQAKKLPANRSEMIKARLKYRRGHGYRFFSHLDFLRLFHKAFRRARIVLAYTEGFNPRPRLSFGPPLPTGYLSNAEYLDFCYYDQPGLNVEQALANSLPTGIQVDAIRIIQGKITSLTASINRSDYEVEFNQDFDVQQLTENCLQMLQENSIQVERKTPRGMKTVDIRPFIIHVAPKTGGSGLLVQLNDLNGRTARIDEVIHWVTRNAIDAKRTLVTRSGQYMQIGARSLTPMEF